MGTARASRQRRATRSLLRSARPAPTGAADTTPGKTSRPLSGRQIVAVCDGTVAFAGWDGPYGNKVIITHADGTQTMYAHMLRLAVRGGPVRSGQTIGYLGGTGNVTGPHLHFEALVNGTAVDPIAWLHRHGVTP